MQEPKAAWYEPLAERDLVPDWILRAGIRRLIRQRLQEEDRGGPERQQAHLMRYIGQLKDSPVAVDTPAANQQHYEVPAEFFAGVLIICCVVVEFVFVDIGEISTKINILSRRHFSSNMRGITTGIASGTQIPLHCVNSFCLVGINHDYINTTLVIMNAL